jgi:hypothetical protein
LVFIREMPGGRGLPHPPVPGGGVGVGVAAGVGVGVGFGVAVGLGVGVPPTGIFGIGTVRIGEAGVFVGCVGNSSVIVWHPTRMNASATTPQLVVFIATSST